MSAASHSTLTVTSQSSFSKTDENLKFAIESRGLKIFAVVDHGKGAKSVDQDIGNSKLYIFGNPKGGTPLMIANPHMGLELPLKMLLNESVSGDVKISYKDIAIIAENNKITEKDALLTKISGNLAAIAKEAAK